MRVEMHGVLVIVSIMEDPIESSNLFSSISSNLLASVDSSDPQWSSEDEEITSNCSSMMGTPILKKTDDFEEVDGYKTSARSGKGRGS